MSKTQNNKELVRVGHEFAKAMSADTPIIEIAKMMSRLAERLDCTTAALHGTQAQRDQLAAENVALKSAIDSTIGWQQSADAENVESVRMLIDIKTPDTDAYMVEVRNEAVARYANKHGFSFQHGSIHAHFGKGDVMVGSVTFENGDAGINFAPVHEKNGGVGTHYEWTRGKTAEQVGSVFVIASSTVEGLEVIQGKLSEAIAQLRKGAPQPDMKELDAIIN